MFVRDTWYMAAWASEVGETPFARTILGERVVFYRTAGGAPAALFDRCPHRFAPLRIGKVQGDVLQCGYHGLTFGPDGVCVRNPHGDGRITRNMRVKSYPVAERDGVIWIWMGDAERADESLIHRFPFMADTARYTTVSGYLNVKAQYQLVTDNLLDLSHTQFVHPLFQSDDTVLEKHSKIEVGEDANSLWSKVVIYDAPPHAFAAMFTDEPRVDNWVDTYWYAPSLIMLDIGTTAAGVERGPDAVETPGVHFLTPESEGAAHYFWVMGRNVRLADAELSQRMWSAVNAAFTLEDEPIIELQQLETGGRDIMTLKPLLLQTDAAPVRARHIVSGMLAAEAARAKTPVR